MKVKKVMYTKQGYSYIKCKREDCLDWGGLAKCDSCNEDMIDNVFLIYILGQAFCQECFEKWEQRAKRYTEDIKLQEENDERWYRAYGFKVS